MRVKIGFRTLLDEPPAGFELPARLKDMYGGNLSLVRPVTYANFVSSVDGVVSGDGVTSSVISQDSRADRFLMGLLRSFADCILIGAGTLRPEPRGLWTPEYIFGDAADEFAVIRRDLGLVNPPRLVVLTRSGAVDPSSAALQQGATVITTESGRARLEGSVSPACRIVSLGPDPAMEQVFEFLAGEGAQSILTEGGPQVMGQMVAGGMIDELFLTVSPVVAGRAGTGRLGFVEGHAFPAGSLPNLQPVSVKVSGTDLFLRYRFRKDTGAQPRKA